MGYEGCRDAKTAEEYLLKCLFEAEDQRDYAVNYCNEVRKAEEERIAAVKAKEEEMQKKVKDAPVFQVVERKCVKYTVKQYSSFVDKDYGLNNSAELRKVLKKNDDELFEWATKAYVGPNKWYSITPISREVEIFDYTLSFESNEELFVFGSTYSSPEYFKAIMIKNLQTGEFFDFLYDVDLKEIALKELREQLEKAIECLVKRGE